jgi:hypothetical protein
MMLDHGNGVCSVGGGKYTAGTYALQLTMARYGSQACVEKFADLFLFLVWRMRDLLLLLLHRRRSHNNCNKNNSKAQPQ